MLTDLSKFVLAETVLRFKGGERIFTRNRFPSSLFYVVIEGLVMLSRDCGKLPYIVGWFGPGRAIGFESGSQFTATAVDECMVLALSRHNPGSWCVTLLDTTAFFSGLSEQLAETVSEIAARNAELLSLEIPARIKLAIQRISRIRGLAEFDGEWIRINLLHAELGAFAGVSRESTSLCLSKLRRAGRVKTSHGSFMARRSWIDS